MSRILLLIALLLSACAGTGERPAASGAEPGTETRDEEARHAEGLPPGGGRAPVAPGVELAWRTVGEGPVTVLVPNLSQSPDPGPLAESVRLVLYDVRGRGRSTPWDDEMEISVARDVADLEALRGHLGLDRVAVLGASYFGALAALYAAEHPERVDRVVMLAPLSVREETWQRFQESRPPHPEDDREEARMEELRARGVDRSDPAEYCRESYRVGRHDLFGDPETAPPLDLSFCDLPNEHLPRMYAWAGRIFDSIQQWDFRPQVRRVQAPVLILQGEADRIVPPEGALEWATALPDARVEFVPGAGHLLRHERPDALAELVGPFLLGR